MTAKHLIIGALIFVATFTGTLVYENSQVGDQGNSIASKEWQAYRNSAQWRENLKTLGTTEAEMQERWTRHFESLRNQARTTALGIAFGAVALVGLLYLVAVEAK